MLPLRGTVFFQVEAEGPRFLAAPLPTGTKAAAGDFGPAGPLSAVAAQDPSPDGSAGSEVVFPGCSGFNPVAGGSNRRLGPLNSRMMEWCTSRSTAAMVVMGSLKI